MKLRDCLGFGMTVCLKTKDRTKIIGITVMKKNLLSILLLISLTTFMYACGGVGSQDSTPSSLQGSTSQDSSIDESNYISDENSSGDSSIEDSSEDNSNKDSNSVSLDENETEILPW